MPDKELSERILEAVSSKGYKPQRAEELAVWIGIGAKEYGEFRDAIKALHKTGRVAIGTHDTILLPEPASKLIGTYRANPRGFGFLIPETPNARGDLFIPPGHQLDAVTGDVVLAKVVKRGHRGGSMLYEGRIIKILSRGNNRFVGQLEHSKGEWFVIPDGNILHVPIFIPDAKSKNARVGMQVVVEIVQYPSEGTPARGVIVEILGEAGSAEVDTLSIIRQYHLPYEFPDACISEASRAAGEYQNDASLDRREDFRDGVIVTIDPVDARDFDDAISLRNTNGTWELGVHIADVSHFVETGSAIDQEARLRANSVYFPGHVIPMLPEVLSNGVCSLQEGVDRLVKSAIIQYDEEGSVIEERFANGVIRSACRLTYEQATGILEGKIGGYAPEVVELVRQMEKLARIIEQRRRKAGMLHLELPKSELVLDDEGKVQDVKPEDQSYSHTVIEMFMIEANEASARLLTRLKVPHLRRIHPDPDPFAFEAASRFLQAMGLRLPKDVDRLQIQEILEQVRGEPESFSVNMTLLRCLERAEYAPQQIGHYALASNEYSHFTSPIRRYADLTIHRLLQLHLEGRLTGSGGGSDVHSHEELVELGQHCSFNERRADDAEQELKLVKLLRHLCEHVGDEFPGVVSGVTKFGVFIQLDKYLIEGLVHLESLSDDWWELDAELGCLIGQRTGRRIRMGDIVRVSIVGIDVPARQLNLRLLDQRPSQRKKKKSTSKRSGKSKSQQGGSKSRRRSRR